MTTLRNSEQDGDLARWPAWMRLACAAVFCALCLGASLWLWVMAHRLAHYLGWF